MRFILDSHVLLWFSSGDSALSKKAEKLITDEKNSLYLSMASIIEMAIKHSLGKLRLTAPFETFIVDETENNNIEILPITQRHAFVLDTLPFYHRDPFDRLLICQSIVEKIPILGNDLAFDNYGIERIW